MAIKRRFTQSPLRKELQQLADMPHFGDAAATLYREGKLFARDEDAAEALLEEFNNIETKDTSGKNAPVRVLVKPEDWERIDGILGKLRDMVLSIADERDALQEKLDAYR